MQSVFDLDIDSTRPDVTSILKAQGIPDNIQPEQKIIDLAQNSLSIYDKLAHPKGLIKELSIEQFKLIYSGEGSNEKETPLDDIHKLSNQLALFSVTVGQEICDKISELFEQNDYALALMLDSAASEGVENGAIFLEQTAANNWAVAKRESSEIITRFSPGYCGWHISGQRKLFDFLRPENIGIKLSNSFLMEPIKSISGLLIAGKKEIFDFDDNFDFCADCTNHSCRDREYSSPASKK